MSYPEAPSRNSRHGVVSCQGRHRPTRYLVWPSVRERATLLRLQTDYLQYFLDNQTADSLILDRQANFGPLRTTGLCSTSATGMGFIAIALASAEPHRLLNRQEAVGRNGRGVETAPELPHTEAYCLTSSTPARGKWSAPMPAAQSIAPGRPRVRCGRLASLEDPELIAKLAGSGAIIGWRRGLLPTASSATGRTNSAAHSLAAGIGSTERPSRCM